MRIALKILVFLSDFAVPIVVFYLVAYGMLKKCDVYDVFVTGAMKGLKTVVGIFPTLVGLLVAVGILRTSGFLEDFSKMLVPIGDVLHIPEEIIPLAFVKMFSSSAATGLLLDIFKEHGTDSYLGFCAALMCSSTETIFYTMSVYFVSAGVKKTRWTLAGAIIASLAGIVASIVLANRIILSS